MATIATTIALEYNFGFYGFVTALTLLLYDYFLTLDREVQFAWKRGASVTTILFYTVRYSGLLAAFIIFFEAMLPSLHRIPGEALGCSALKYLSMVLQITLYGSANVFSALRASALLRGNRIIYVVTLLFGVAYCATCIYSYTQLEPLYYDFVDYTLGLEFCAFNYRDAGTERLPSAIIAILCSRALSIVIDIIVLVATWVRTCAVNAEARRISFSATYATILFKDGTIYFIAHLIANTICLAISPANTGRTEPLLTWSLVVTSILTSRFMLDLYEAADSPQHSYYGPQGLSTSGTLPSLQFRQHPPSSVSLPDASVYGMMLTDIDGDNEFDHSRERFELEVLEDCDSLDVLPATS